MMALIEQGIIQFLLLLMDGETINSFLRDPRTVAILVGALVSISGAWLGSFLLLRKMSLTSDAISHTVLLGIVVAFIFLGAMGLHPSVNSPLLLIGAALAGVATVILTELIRNSGLVKADAALGLAFPLLFAIAIILVSSKLEDVHIDEHTVLVGEIGVAWANTNSYCFDNCEDVVIIPDSPQAEVGRQCVNCSRGGISPRDPEAQFEETCSNCGTYTAAEAWGARLIDAPPTLIFFPKSLSVMGVITLINVLFVLFFYKELKLAAFDEALAKALGFRPAALTYALMTLVSLTAVGAFDAVGSILVVSFFVIPAGAAYLLTDRLSRMLLYAPMIGILGTITGYELARGSFLGLPVSGFLTWLDSTIGLGGYTTWNVSISASMVMMTFFFFIVAWVLSPHYGLVSTLFARQRRRQEFADLMLLGHVAHHEGTEDAEEELAVNTLHEHLNWSQLKLQTSLTRARMHGWLQIKDQLVHLTEQGHQEIERFRSENLRHSWQDDAVALVAIGD